MKAKIQPRINSSVKGDLAKAIPLSTPYSIHIDPCSLCNFKCKFCFQSQKDKPKQGTMNDDLFLKIVNDLIMFSEPIRKIKIGLHGEPTLHPRLPGMLWYLKYKQIANVVELFTNGSLLNPTLNKDFISAGLDRINISVEGLSQKEYKEMTGVKVYIDRFIKNIKHLYLLMLLNRGSCKIYIKTITQDKEKFYNMFGDICDEIFVENIVPQWSGIGNPELPKVGMYGQPIKQWKEVCPFPFMYLHYNWDGSVSPCTLDWGHKVIIGDANKESALEIWNGQKLKDLRIKMLEGKRREIPFCDKCLAPMVCCNEDLDNQAKELLERIR
jgi:radical SAM protein with 4Fe4S-binding SPASM domain